MPEPRPPTYPYVWRWLSKLPERKGHRCRIVRRWRMTSVVIEFESDKHQVQTSTNALKRSEARS